ncbi:helix-turn-helix domain-containing protein [Chitinophaga sp. CF418]|uniref:helix-turn-helix domain-containing protein n=1 Tax=Chitinophaga sp. CF418 TaxID=1855287 RepID=UPI000920F5D6|nr:helix-turn-helix domain-containing protein [Chitinophaga sp. CF418]SHN37039.1 AraC-type DNA-binding protein [Chitinophaga sp. CF418]
MKLVIKDPISGGTLLLFKNEERFDRLYYGRDKDTKYFTIAWNAGETQTVTIDGEEHTFKSHTLLAMMFNQSFSFERPTDIVAWQFNREFYCIVDHDREVSCVGFIFGMDKVFITLDPDTQQRLELMLDIFVLEMNTVDNIQSEMLLMLLKRLIITITQLARSEYIPDKKQQQDGRFHIIRKFNLLVEEHFRAEHSVSYYAQLLNKSPKTLSNLFAIFNQKTPTQIIQERIIIEAKRLLRFTNKSPKQITFELGFEDPAYFSNFFKKHTNATPLEFRNTKVGEV